MYWPFDDKLQTNDNKILKDASIVFRSDALP
jgi:hypothetical protein